MRHQRFLIVCGCLASLGCWDSTSIIRGVVLFHQGHETLPAESVVVHALPLRNEIDRELAALCASDSLLNANGGLEIPIGAVRVQAEGVELDASVASARPGDGRERHGGAPSLV